MPIGLFDDLFVFNYRIGVFSVVQLVEGTVFSFCRSIMKSFKPGHEEYILEKLWNCCHLRRLSLNDRQVVFSVSVYIYIYYTYIYDRLQGNLALNWFWVSWCVW